MHGYGLDSLSELSFKKCSGVPLIAPSLWACGTRFGRFSIRIRQVRRRLSPCCGLERESSVEDGRCEFCRGLREAAVRDLALKRPRKWPRGGSSLIFDQKPLGKQGEGSYRCILTIRPALRPKMRGPMNEGRGKRAFATGRRVGAAVATRPCTLRWVSSCCVLLVCAAPVAGDAARASAVVSPWNRCPLRQRLRIKPRSAGKRGGPARRGTSPALRRGMMRRSCAAILLFGV